MGSLKKIDEDEHFQDAIEDGCAQWACNENQFAPVGQARSMLPPGIYEIKAGYSGVKFLHQNASFDDLCILDQTHEDILNQLNLFWQRKDEFHAHKLAHKRGVLLHGPSGTGKSGIVKHLNC